MASPLVVMRTTSSLTSIPASDAVLAFDLKDDPETWRYRLTISKQARKHELRAVAYGIDSAILNDNTLVADKEGFQRDDDFPQVRLVSCVVHHPLSIKNIVERYQTMVLIHGSTPHSSQFLHVRANTEEQTLHLRLAQ